MFTKKRPVPFIWVSNKGTGLFYLSISISVTNFGELVKVSATGQVLSINMHNECKKVRPLQKKDLTKLRGIYGAACIAIFLESNAASFIASPIVG